MRSKKGMDTIWSFIIGIVVAILVAVVLIGWIRSCTVQSECDNLASWEGFTKELSDLDSGKVSESSYFFNNNDCQLTSFVYNQWMTIQPESQVSLEKPYICLCQDLKESNDNICLFDRNRCFLFKNIKGINTAQFTTKDYGNDIILKLSRENDQLTIVPEGAKINENVYTIPVTVKDIALSDVSLIIQTTETLPIDPIAYISKAESCPKPDVINLNQKQICFKIDKITSKNNENIELSPSSIKGLSIVFKTNEIGSDKIPVYYSQEKASVYTRELIPKENNVFALIHIIEGVPSSFLITQETCLNFRTQEQKSSEIIKSKVNEKESVGFKYILNKDLKGNWVFVNYYKLENNEWIVTTSPSKEQLARKEQILLQIKDLNAASGYPLITEIIKEPYHVEIKEVQVPINEIILTQNNPSCELK